MTDHQDRPYHVPALLAESVEGLDIRPGGVYVDATFGGGGHSREILSRLDGRGRLYALDQDADAEAEAGAITDGRFTFIRTNFRYLENWMRYHGEDGLDGLIADLGVSSHHLDDGKRGFSLRHDAPLDMRMNRRAGLTAARIVATYSEERLRDILARYGEVRNPGRMASALARARREREIATTGDLMDVMGPLLPRERERKEAAKVFQALRMEVNDEMGALGALLAAAARTVRPGGRLSVITYHSLEDRMVKNFIRAGSPDGRVERDFYGRARAPFAPVNSKVITPGEDEVASNPRSRSAKLRIGQRA